MRYRIHTCLAGRPPAHIGVVPGTVRFFPWPRFSTAFPCCLPRVRLAARLKAAAARMRRLAWAVTLIACTLTGSLLPGRAALLRPRRLGPSCAVRALAKAKSKRQGRGKAPSGGSATSKGFGAPPPRPPPPPPPPPPARAAAPGGADPQLVAVDLGRGKQVSVMLPPQAQEPSEAELRRLETSAGAEAQQGVLGAYTHLYGAGDVVWPASVALARLLAHVPSFSAGQRVLELGCGLGAVGLAAGTAGAATVLLTDREAPLLALAAQALTLTLALALTLTLTLALALALALSLTLALALTLTPTPTPTLALTPILALAPTGVEGGDQRRPRGVGAPAAPAPRPPPADCAVIAP